MHRIFLKAVLPLAMALLLALAACGSSEYEPAAPTVAPAPTSAPAAAVVTAAPPPQQQPVVVATQGAETEGFNAVGGSATVNDAAYDLTFFRHYGVNPFIDTEDDHLSTFAIDVDTASYTVARRFLDDGNLPDPDSVRVEEFVNFFDQGYETPTDDAFAIHVEGAPSPFGSRQPLADARGTAREGATRRATPGCHPSLHHRHLRLHGPRRPLGAGATVPAADGGRAALQR